MIKKKKLSLNYLNSEKKSKIESKSDFDINLKIYKRSNIKINNTKNIFQKNKMLVVCFLIIKYLFISNISCNNKGLFKLNDSIIKLELNVTEKGYYSIFSSGFKISLSSVCALLKY